MFRNLLLIIPFVFSALFACSSNDTTLPVAPALCQEPADVMLPWHAEYDDSFEDPCYNPFFGNSLAVSGGNVYYATVSAICAIDHEGQVTVLVDGRTVSSPLPARAFWVTNDALVFVNGIAIYTVPLAGGTPSQIAPLSWPLNGSISAYGFDGGYVYWGTGTDGETASVFRISLAGGSVENLDNENGFGVEHLATAPDQVDFVPIANFASDPKPLWRIQPSTAHISSLGDVSWAGALLTDNGALAYVRAGNHDLSKSNSWDDSDVGLYTIDGNANRQSAWDADGFPHLTPLAAGVSELGVYVGGRLKYRDGDYAGIGQIPNNGQPRTVVGCTYGNDIDAMAVDVSDVYAIVGANLTPNVTSRTIVRFRGH